MQIPSCEITPKALAEPSAHGCGVRLERQSIFTLNADQLAVVGGDRSIACADVEHTASNVDIGERTSGDGRRSPSLPRPLPPSSPAPS